MRRQLVETLCSKAPVTRHGPRTTVRPIYRLLSTVYLSAVLPTAAAFSRAAEPVREAWDYAPAARQVAARGIGRPGVVLHIGDSMTYSNPYGQWARAGAGKTADDKAVLEWMHTGADNDLDGWWLCRFDHPDGGRSYTAAGGLRLDELLAGGKQGLPALSELLERKPSRAKKSGGETTRLSVTRDVWFSEVGKEAEGNNGGSDRLKVKSIQEMSLLDFDPAPLRGRVVRWARLHVRMRGEEILHCVTVGTFSSEWVEGTAANYEPQKGSSCFNWREYPDVPWAYRGSDLCEVIFGRGGSRWRTTDASPPAEGGWQTIAVDPSVIAARVAGCGYGLFVFDDTGSEWSRDGEKFNFRHFPNRFFHSRESGERNAPYLTVELGERDDQPPLAPTAIKAETNGLPSGEARVSWATPQDRGPGETIGFQVELDGKPLPRYLVPIALAAGERATMPLRDLQPAANVELAVRAVDSAGNEGPAEKLRFNLPDRPQAVLPPRRAAPQRAASPLPTFAGAEIAVIDELDKIDLATDKGVPSQTEAYLAENHLWSAEKREIHLYAAKNEFARFQLLVKGAVRDLTLATSFPGHETKFAVQWHRLQAIPLGQSAYVDPALPMKEPAAGVPDPVQTVGGARGRSPISTLLCEVYVPHNVVAGEYMGHILLGKNKGFDKTQLGLKVRLTVWDFTLPDYLSFLPEMNCYGLRENERDYYRLAHKHRTFLNRLPYHQNGSMAEGCAPVWDGKQLNWEAWDKRFGPYLDGPAFADLPRRGVPVDGFYLPWHENWPSPMEGNYNGDYWADRAFSERYRRALIEVARQLSEHFNQRGWHDTLFQGFLNNKNNYKENGWSRGSSPWLLDEPANFQDYWALRWFGQAFHEGADPVRGKAKLLYRCDISRPQWQRDLLDDVLDYNVVGGAMRRYRRMVLDRKEATGQMVIEYGSANAIDQSNVQPAAWCIDAWSLGADGVLPWQTIGNDESWRQADTLALFYPGKPAGYDEPIASLRLKAFRRGQQDVEYLTLYSQLKQAPRWQIGQEVRQWLGLAGERRPSDVAAAEDAGVIHYADLRPQDLWALRRLVGEQVSAEHPPAKRRLIEFNVLPRSLRPMSGFVAEGE